MAKTERHIYERENTSQSKSRYMINVKYRSTNRSAKKINFTCENIICCEDKSFKSFIY